MFKKNNLNIGIGLGILIPLIIFGIFSSIVNASGANFKLRTVALISICFNIGIMRLFKKNRAATSVQGTVYATVGLAALWLVYFGEEIYNEW
jgi:sulfite exporter TauE/SafE